jgi:hypothetical protein
MAAAARDRRHAAPRATAAPHPACVPAAGRHRRPGRSRGVVAARARAISTVSLSSPLRCSWTVQSTELRRAAVEQISSVHEHRPLPATELICRGARARQWRGSGTPVAVTTSA